MRAFILLLFAAAFGVFAGTAGTLEINFNSTDGWSKTKGAAFSVKDNIGVLEGRDWDSKIFKEISLSPNTFYEFSGTGRGKVMVRVYTGFFKQVHAQLNLSGTEWHDNSIRFRTPAGGSRFLLCIQVNAAKGHAEVRKLRFAPAQENKADRVVLDPEKLRANRPSPEIVRGFMVGTFNGKVAKAVREWGANAVRLQYAPMSFARRKKMTLEQAWPEYLDRIEKDVQTAKDNGLKVIIDLHGAPVTGKGPIWKNPALEKNFVKVWRDIATRLKPYSDTVWGYDLYNEPLDRNQLPYPPKEWRPLAIRILKAIREIDPNVWLIYEPGPGGGSSGLNGMDLLPDYRVIYSSHFYAPAEFTHQGIHNIDKTDLQKAHEQLDVRYPGIIHVNGRPVKYDKSTLEQKMKEIDRFLEKYPVPYYIGEFSVVCWAPKGSGEAYLRDVIELFEKRGWSWTYHAFAEWQGWDLSYEGYVVKDNRLKAKYAGETERGKVVREALKRNHSESLPTDKTVSVRDANYSNDFSLKSMDGIIFNPSPSARCLKFKEKDGNDCLKIEVIKPERKTVKNNDGSGKTEESVYASVSLGNLPVEANSEYSYEFSLKGNMPLVMVQAQELKRDAKTGKPGWSKPAAIDRKPDGVHYIRNIDGTWKTYRGTLKTSASASRIKLNVIVFSRTSPEKMSFKPGDYVLIDNVRIADSKGTNLFTHLTFLEEKRSRIKRKQPGEYVILFKGNSITSHGTNADVKKRLGWDRTCGMAASSLEKDYVHLLAARIQSALPGKKVRIAYGAGGIKAMDTLNVEYAHEPDLIVYQGGEHWWPHQKEYEKWLPEFLQALLKFPKNPQVIFIGCWALDHEGIPVIQRKIAALYPQIEYVSVGRINQNPQAKGSGTNPGVKWHPNDVGMAGYADLAFAAWRKKNSPAQ